MEDLENKFVNKLPVILDIYHLSNLVGIKYNLLKDILSNKDKYYHTFYISKKMGGKRKIEAPNEVLASLQKYIKNEILDNILVSEYAFGFVKEKNILLNAKSHLNQEMVLNIDLENFFPTIKEKRVFHIFYKLCKYDYHISKVLTNLVTLQGRLPQGACTSPVISNITAYKLDKRLSTYAKKLNLIYTRYADDITFSGSKKIINDFFLENIQNIIKDCGFVINDKKTRFCSQYGRQEVTGLIINDNYIHINKKYIREIRQELYYINKFGVSNHRNNKDFSNMYYREHLLGKILFVKSIHQDIGLNFLNQFQNIDWEK